MLKIGVCWLKGYKVNSYQIWRSAFQPQPHSNRSARIREHPGSNHSQSLMAGNFVALWPTDPKFSALKDLNLFSTLPKVQEASRILRMCFALSKWPHLLHKMGFVDSLTQTTVGVAVVKVAAREGDAYVALNFAATLDFPFISFFWLRSKKLLD